MPYDWELVDYRSPCDDVYDALTTLRGLKGLTTCQLERPYDDEAKTADWLLEVNEALQGEHWVTAVELCEEALTERPRWSEMRAARDRVNAHIAACASGQSPPSPSITVMRGALVSFNTDRDPVEQAPRTSLLGLPDDALLQVMSCLSYPRCALLAPMDKRLLALVRSKPLASRRAGLRVWYLVAATMRDSAKFNAKPPQERRYHTRHGFSENAKEELALIAKDFPGALHERHLPPYAIKRTGFMRYGAWRFSRVFGKSPDEVYEDIQNDAAWHGPLPDEPITPLELAVSYADRDESDLMVQTLFDFGAKATKQALDITNASRYTNLRCWTMLLLGNQPDLLSTTVYNLDFCAIYVDVDNDDKSSIVLVVNT